MKHPLSRVAFLSALSLSLTLTGLRAQDAPPPPPDGGGNYDSNQGPDNGPGPDNGSGMDDNQDNGPAPDNGPSDNNGGDNGGGDVSYQTFYDNLGNDGSWIQTDDYGYVFQPNAVQDPNWAPYTDGHWVYSDVGWVWVSDESWGWATYHYGRWANIDGTGWCWVPGYQWAPAWVSWRYGGGYAGWAPLPPGAAYGGASFHFGSDVDAQFGIGIGFYNFVPVGNLGYSNYRGYYANRGDNINIYNRTTNITNIYVGNKYGVHGSGAFRGVKAGGPPIAEVNAHSAHPIRTVQLTSAGGVGRSRLNGNSLAIYAPHMNKSNGRQARPPQVARNIGHANLRSGNNGGNANPGRTGISNQERTSTTSGYQHPTTHIGTPSSTHHHQTQSGYTGESNGYNRQPANTTMENHTPDVDHSYTQHRETTTTTTDRPQNTMEHHQNQGGPGPNAVHQNKPAERPQPAPAPAPQKTDNKKQ